MKKIPSRIRGTADTLDLTLLSYALATIRRHCTNYSLTEISTPILEPIELFERSLGNETDVVSKEMYRAQPLTAHDSSERICLRPEGTASILRAYVTEGVQQKPWRVFMYGPMFRHERPQKGRLRQFHQVTIEYLGAPSITHDIELITLLERLFHDTFKLNSYALALNFLGCKNDRAQFNKILIDFINAQSAELCSLCIERSKKNILRIFDCKENRCQEVYKSAPHTIDHLCIECAQEWQTVQQTVEQLSVSFTILPTLVRGLDYYTKTVFEFISSSSLGAQSTFCGGGRYDELAPMLIGEELPAVGAAIGVERLLMMLDEIKDRLPLPHAPPLTAILPLEQKFVPLALIIADELRAHNIAVEVIVDGGSPKSMLRYADKIGAVHAVLLGENEVASGNVMVKYMATGEQKLLPQRNLRTTLTML